MMRNWFSGLLSLALASAAIAAFGQDKVEYFGDEPNYDAYECGPIVTPNGFGPFDYREPRKQEKELVESGHYNPGMDAVRKGKMTDELGFVWNQFDYTLRAFPNHPGSLIAIDQLSIKLKSDKPPRAARSAYCYFARAIHYRPDDGLVRLFYGLYLLRREKYDDAIVQLKRADILRPNDANVQYNMGLAYLRKKDYDNALTYAHRAYALGFQLPGLKNQLQSAGKWRPPVAPNPDAGAASPGTSAAPTNRE